MSQPPDLQRLCCECGEPIDEKRLRALPGAMECIECAKRAVASGIVAAPRKALEARPIATTFHVKRYLMNVGQKTDPKAVFRTLVRLNYLFPNISPAEMTPVLLQWCKRTESPFNQAQIGQLVLDAKQWVSTHPNQPRTRRDGP